MLTALVIDASAAARSQVTGLLELAGWGVHEAGDAQDARWLSSTIAVDLVVTAAAVPGAADGAALLHELRAAGSTARFLMVAPDPTDEVRAAALAAGALACLPAPVDARLVLDLLRSRSAAPLPVVRDMVDVDDLHDTDLDADLLDRLQEVYDDALPTRFSAIDRSVRAGDPRAAADAAHTLAGTSGQLGHPEVADVCQAIASDARRGIMAHALVSELAGLTGIDRRVADRRRSPRVSADRRVARADRRARLASTADVMSSRGELGGLLHAADAATGRLAARRRGMAA